MSTTNAAFGNCVKCGAPVVGSCTWIGHELYHPHCVRSDPWSHVSALDEITHLKTDRDSWRRVAETLKAELAEARRELRGVTALSALSERNADLTALVVRAGEIVRQLVEDIDSYRAKPEWRDRIGFLAALERARALVHEIDEATK